MYRQKVKNAANSHYYHFDSVIDLQEYLHGNRDLNSPRYNDAREVSLAWSGGLTLEQAFDALTHFDRKDVDYAAMVASIRATMPPIEDYEIRWTDDPGIAFDVAAALEGPEHWLSRDAAVRPKYRIGVSISVLAVVDASSILARGAAVGAFIDALSDLADVEVYALIGQGYGSESTHTAIRIKDASESFDPTRLRFPLTHPGMFRRIGLRLMELYHLIDRAPLRSGYGTALDWDDDATGLAFSFIVPRQHYYENWADPEYRAARVREWIEMITETGA
jgi:hypothetical protein